MDSWLDDHPFLPLHKHQVPGSDHVALVRDLWIDGRGWNWVELVEILSYSSLMELALTTINVNKSEGGKMGWLKEEGGVFSIASAYEHCVGSNNGGEW